MWPHFFLKACLLVYLRARARANACACAHQCWCITLCTCVSACVHAGVNVLCAYWRTCLCDSLAECCLLATPPLEATSRTGFIASSALLPLHHDHCLLSFSSFVLRVSRRKMSQVIFRVHLYSELSVSPFSRVLTMFIYLSMSLGGLLELFFIDFVGRTLWKDFVGRSVLCRTVFLVYGVRFRTNYNQLQTLTAE